MNENSITSSGGRPSFSPVAEYQQGYTKKGTLEKQIKYIGTDIAVKVEGILGKGEEGARKTEDWQPSRKVAILKAKDASGTELYYRVNLKSLQKDLNLSKTEIKQLNAAVKNGDLISFVDEKVKRAQKYDLSVPLKKLHDGIKARESGQLEEAQTLITEAENEFDTMAEEEAKAGRDKKPSYDFDREVHLRDLKLDCSRELVEIRREIGAKKEEAKPDVQRSTKWQRTSYSGIYKDDAYRDKYFEALRNLNHPERSKREYGEQLLKEIDDNKTHPYRIRAHIELERLNQKKNRI